jgi:type IV secretory pathway VirD2 relaxase
MPGHFISTEKKFNLSDDQTKARLFSAKLGVNSSSVRREAASVKVKQEKIEKIRTYSDQKAFGNRVYEYGGKGNLIFIPPCRRN